MLSIRGRKMRHPGNPKSSNQKKRFFPGKVSGKLMLVMLMAALLSLIPGTGVLAEESEEFDPDRTDGSITLLLEYEDTKTSEMIWLTDGEVTLYKVSDVVVDENGNYGFDISTGQFPNARGVSNLTKRLASESSLLALLLSRQIGSVEGTKAEIDNGLVFIGDLTPGLYLMTQTKISSESIEFNPFLFTIPFEGNYEVTHSSVYEVTAKPKLVLQYRETEEPPTEPETLLPPPEGDVTEKPSEVPTERPTEPPTEPGTQPPSGDKPPTETETSTTPPSTPSTPSTPTTPTTPSGGTLPQTGQLWWPVPILLIAGFLLAVIGIVVRKRA